MFQAGNPTGLRGSERAGIPYLTGGVRASSFTAPDGDVKSLSVHPGGQQIPTWRSNSRKGLEIQGRVSFEGSAGSGSRRRDRNMAIERHPAGQVGRVARVMVGRRIKTTGGLVRLAQPIDFSGFAAGTS